MSKNTIRLAASLVVTTGAVALASMSCAGQGQGVSTMQPGTVSGHVSGSNGGGDGHSENSAAPTQEILEQTKDYPSWPMFADYEEGPVKSQGHGGMWVVAHYNGAAAPAVHDPGRDFPDGSILVKENRPDPDAPPAALTTMAKRSGDWVWIKHKPDGEVIEAGEVQSCIGCHSAAEHDMVFSGASQ